MDKQRNETASFGERAIYPILYLILALSIVNIILDFIILNNHIFVK